MEGMNIWKTMSQIDTRKLVEKKNGFTYLSWSHALRLLKDHVPDAMVTKHIFKQPDGTFLPYMVDPAGFAYVQVTVTLGKDVAAATEIMPVLNHANRPVQKPNSFEVNASLQRCMAKAISMATGLGIHLYSGEDLPQSFAGPDNSGVKANEGTASTIYSYHDDKTATGAVPSGNLKQLSLAEEIAMCPDIEALKTLYNRVQLRLTAEDRQLFTSRKKEFING
jgi:hypothetical protein